VKIIFFTSPWAFLLPEVFREKESPTDLIPPFSNNYHFFGAGKDYACYSKPNKKVSS
jgi:hypothetical protein|tara:strand:- start:1298 stop:1468 length:171 start_codon:yes stop_codon:yes gene_type:complete